VPAIRGARAAISAHVTSGVPPPGRGVFGCVDWARGVIGAPHQVGFDRLHGPPVLVGQPVDAQV
jgi:hypothetical protein